MTDLALESLPHREPFRFLSSIMELKAGERGIGVWRVSGREGFFAGHFPTHPVLPGVLLAESLAQLSGVVAFSASSDAHASPARLAQVNIKFHVGVTPPAEIRLESELLRVLSGLYLFDVRADVHGVLAASGTLVLANATKNRTYTGDPDDPALA